jgi:hypothetical protein
MGPPKTTAKAGRSISQEAFDDLVKENMDDLGMDPTEALQDAIQTLSLQGVDLSGPISQNHHFLATLRLIPEKVWENQKENEMAFSSKH